MNATHPDQHEAINCMAAVIGASLVGIDKRNQDGFDYVRMCNQYFSPTEGGAGHFHPRIHCTPRVAGARLQLVFLYVNMLASSLDDRYPGHAGLDTRMRSPRTTWRR